MSLPLYEEPVPEPAAAILRVPFVAAALDCREPVPLEALLEGCPEFKVLLSSASILSRRMRLPRRCGEEAESMLAEEPEPTPVNEIERPARPSPSSSPEEEHLRFLPRTWACDGMLPGCCGGREGLRARVSCGVRLLDAEAVGVGVDENRPSAMFSVVSKAVEEEDEEARAGSGNGRGGTGLSEASAYVGSGWDVWSATSTMACGARLPQIILQKMTLPEGQLGK